jgi:hypothetical protein
MRCNVPLPAFLAQVEGFQSVFVFDPSSLRLTGGS